MKKANKYTDPLEDLYLIRQKISARYGHDVSKLAEAAKEWKRQDEANGIRYVKLPIARRTEPVVK